ncbi:hypothetical protein [Marinobacter halotolerans]|uniref:hypothetical protein n=1 Tax=Marinobacter halotolerans TaxID=1569211 RepID=UPI001247B738|nr:hypothetical protein [Marinobacter halotolerans]
MSISNIHSTAPTFHRRRPISTVLLSTLFILLTACGDAGIEYLAIEGKGNNEGRPELMAAPQQVSLSVEANRAFRFDWTDAENVNATRYQLLINPDGLREFIPVGHYVPQGTETLVFEVPLHTDINARFKLRACSIRNCADSDPVSLGGAQEAYSLSDAGSVYLN